MPSRPKCLKTYGASSFFSSCSTVRGHYCGLGRNYLREDINYRQQEGIVARRRWRVRKGEDEENRSCIGTTKERHMTFPAAQLSLSASPSVVQAFHLPPSMLYIIVVSTQPEHFRCTVPSPQCYSIPPTATDVVAAPVPLPPSRHYVTFACVPVTIINLTCIAKYFVTQERGQPSHKLPTYKLPTSKELSIPLETLKQKNTNKVCT